MSTHTWATLFWVISLVAFGLAAARHGILRRRGERPLTVRPIPAFQVLDDRIKQAAESGKTVHITLGSGGLIGEDAITSSTGIQVLESLAESIVSYNVPAIITVGDATLLPVAQDVLQRAYERRGLREMYDPTLVRFIAPSPMAYAAGASIVMATEEASTNVIMGDFGPEVSLVADVGARLDILQTGGAASPTSIGALHPVVDHLALGEEMFTAGAQMTDRARYLVSVIAQDTLRFFVVVTILVLVAMKLAASLGA